MKPRRTYFSERVLGLPGGNEDNDLWVDLTADEDDNPVIRSVWEPTLEEREKIAAGQNVYLLVWGTMHPPVAIGVTQVPLGKRP
jgi:hypothetical protein